MKRFIILVLISLSISLSCSAQYINPQSSFATTLLSANPLLYLNFNDTTTAFSDQISNSNFIHTMKIGLPDYSMPASFAGATTAGHTYIEQAPASTVSGNILSFTVYFMTAPPSGEQLTLVVFQPYWTVSALVTVTVHPTSGYQTFSVGTDYTTAPPILAASWYWIGFYVPAGGVSPAYGTDSSGYYQNCNSAPPSPGGTISGCFGNTGIIALTSVVGNSYTSGTVTPRQSGFDNTLVNNTSAEFPYNGWSAAPNNTLGDIDWSSPWTMMIQVDRLNWTRTGTLVLASKGDLSSGNSWALSMQMNGMKSELCFTRGSSTTIHNGVCTNGSMDVMPNGYNYNIVVEDTGQGGPIQYNSTGINTISIYINGLNAATFLGGVSSTAVNGSLGFGFVNLTVSGGTGYANSTPFTSSGGGPNCVVNGTMISSGGVPQSISSPNGYANLGCTSVPTINLTSPSGTGATIVASLTGTSMNSTAYPLMVPGYISSSVINGYAQGNSSENPLYIDEYAIFNGILDQSHVQSLFYWTKFYQSLVYPSQRPKVILDTAYCGGDPSGLWQSMMTYSAHNLGLIELIGVVDNDPIGYPYSTVPWYQQMLDEYGLDNVPLTIGPNSALLGGNQTLCPSANITAYNASTIQDPTKYPASRQMYRTLFASNPSTPIIVTVGQSSNAYGDFLESPADSISSLTGLQLAAQNASNGGWVNFQGQTWCGQSPYISGCLIPNPVEVYTYAGGQPTVPTSNIMQVPQYASYIYSNNGTTPLYIMQGSPQYTNPITYYTRTYNDPAWLASNMYYATLAYAGRPGWNTQQLVQVISPYFIGGVQITYSGGTGYANSTPFTLSGGGPYCTGSGFMTASGGVPNGIITTWGQSVNTNWETIGGGCTSNPTVNLVGATGTGVTLNAYTTTFCMADLINQTEVTPTDTWTEQYSSSTSCSNNQYATMPSSLAAFTDWSGGFAGPPIFTWFQNSIMAIPPQTRPYYQ